MKHRGDNLEKCWKLSLITPCYGTISILCVRCFCHRCHMVEQYSTWGRTYVLYAASFSCLFCVLTFRLMNLRLFLALLVIVFVWDYQVSPRYFAFSVGVVIKCIWEDNRFLFYVYSKNFTRVRVKFHWPFFFPEFQIVFLRVILLWGILLCSFQNQFKSIIRNNDNI